MAIYRKNDDQFPLYAKAKEQEATHTMSDADSGGYLIGFSPDTTVEDYKGMGGGPVSAKGMRMGANAKHWLKDMKNK
jgi:hypothetical protein